MLQRRKPLRAKKGFKSGGGRLKPVSDSRKKKNEEYSKVRKEYLQQVGGRCEVCGGQATDIHHKSKRGKNLCAKDTFLALCRQCHTKIHDNPAWARENGYLVYQYQ